MSSSSSPIILILGAGPNIGQGVARAFAAKGYQVALASRRANEAHNAGNEVHIQSDFSDPNSIVNVFAKVKASLGIPSVVVYNASAATRNPPNDPLSLSLADFNHDLTINTVSPFVAAQQAAIGFAQLPNSASRTFIYTGNITNTNVISPLMDLGVGKSATAHIIQSAAAAYKNRGFKFYYGDERNADGTAVYSNIDADAHGKLYVELAEGKTQGPWQQTFVKGVGYKHFLVA
ncbi:putative short-chain dehydrogenase [Lipomyces tetrasporus]